MISVVVPVYNAERYLPQCIESVCNSNYGDFELILVNDGSTDSSLETCVQYAKKDKRIRILDGENQGASAARNKGIDASRGEWVTFVDADDRICPDFLSIIARQESSDLLVFDFSVKCYCPAASAGQPDESQIRLDTLQTRADFISKLLQYRPLVPGAHTDLRAPWAKAFRRSVLEHQSIRFTEGISVGEDALFNIEFAAVARSCTYVSRTVYLHRVRTGSISRQLDAGYLQSIFKLQQCMRRVLIKSGLFSQVERDYNANALENIAYVLIRGVFASGRAYSAQESRALCDEIRQNDIFREALKLNGQIRNLPRRIILGFFRRGLCVPAGIKCRLCYLVLHQRDRRMEKRWVDE